MLCHLKGIFEESQNTAYETWLLDFIEQHKGLAAPPVPIHELRNGLAIGSLLNDLEEPERRECWDMLSQSLGGVFDTLQMDYNAVVTPQIMQWNRELPVAFHTVLSVAVPTLQSTATPEAQYQALTDIIKLSLEAALLPVDVLHPVPTDTLWTANALSTEINPKTHYILRHVRSALDRMQAKQALLAQSCGSQADVQAYFSDGINEAQLAGSNTLIDAVIQALFTGSAAELSELTGQLHLPSLETGYFNAFPYSEDMLSFFDTSVDEMPNPLALASFILLSCSGVGSIDLELLLALCLPPHTQDMSVCEQLDLFFASEAYQKLRKLLIFREQYPAFHMQGAQIALHRHPHIWGVQRYSPDMINTVLCLANVSSKAQEIVLGEDEISKDTLWRDFNSEKQFQAGESWRLSPGEFLWLLSDKKS